MNAAFPKTRNFKHSGTKEKDFSFWHGDESNKKKRTEPDCSICEVRKIRNPMVDFKF